MKEDEEGRHGMEMGELRREGGELRRKERGEKKEEERGRKKEERKPLGV